MLDEVISQLIFHVSAPLLLFLSLSCTCTYQRAIRDLITGNIAEKPVFSWRTLARGKSLALIMETRFLFYTTLKKSAAWRELGTEAHVDTMRDDCHGEKTVKQPVLF